MSSSATNNHGGLLPNALQANRLLIGAFTLVAVALVWRDVQRERRLDELEALIGAPSRAYYNPGYAGISPGRESYVRDDSGDFVPATPTLWELADSTYAQMIHLRPINDVSPETLIQLAELDAFEVKLLSEDSFWDFYRTVWMDGDEDSDGIANRDDDCPDSPASNDPKPLHLEPYEVQFAHMKSVHGEHNTMAYNPDWMRSVRQRYAEEQEYAERLGLHDWFVERWPNAPDDPPADEADNLYYGCDEVADGDGDGIADYRDACLQTPFGQDVTDYHVVRGPRSLFPVDQGCSASQ